MRAIYKHLHNKWITRNGSDVVRIATIYAFTFISGAPVTPPLSIQLRLEQHHLSCRAANQPNKNHPNEFGISRHRALPPPFHLCTLLPFFCTIISKNCPVDFLCVQAALNRLPSEKFRSKYLGFPSTDDMPDSFGA